MTAAIVDGTLVKEVGEGIAQVRVDSPGVLELEPGTAIELKLSGDSQRYLGTVLALRENGHITVLLDRVALTEQVILVEDTDNALGGLPDNVPPIRGMAR